MEAGCARAGVDEWLPGMDSNHIIDRFCNLRKLLILRSY
jgi:hypothetical protein